MAENLLRLGPGGGRRTLERVVVHRGALLGSTVLRPGVRALPLADTLALV
jgi:hypothetical protein